MTASRPKLESARRLVVKIGSALLVDEESRGLRRPWLDALSDDLAALKAGGSEIIVVSSGAIALGRHQLGLHRRSMRLEESQAAAAGRIWPKPVVPNRKNSTKHWGWSLPC